MSSACSATSSSVTSTTRRFSRSVLFGIGSLVPAATMTSQRVSAHAETSVPSAASRTTSEVGFDGVPVSEEGVLVVERGDAAYVRSGEEVSDSSFDDPHPVTTARANAATATIRPNVRSTTILSPWNGPHTLRRP